MNSQNQIHNQSLEAAERFASLYRDPDADAEMIAKALDEYIALRRQLPREPMTGSRFLASEAFNATQGLTLDS